MNDASSRSHCALILSLYKLDPSDKYIKTTFSMIDLAGSERNSKTGAERVDGNAGTSGPHPRRGSAPYMCAALLLSARVLAPRGCMPLTDRRPSSRCATAFGEAVNCFKNGTPEKLSVGAQGWMINYELSFVQTEILKAGECHRKGMPYKAQKAMSTAGSIYMTACCDGRARLGMIVTLSPSPQHGFECAAPSRPLELAGADPPSVTARGMR